MRVVVSIFDSRELLLEAIFAIIPRLDGFFTHDDSNRRRDF